ncbi:MAG: NUDIX domain-containing protein [Candidatus Methanomethylophilus sp.]|nr:NUDIX domain-containing protein [Methanomethylophilus sp.]MDD3232684.1 NUDIX domain-containing protein [Methanomethylophilus sp.]MDD4221548.1 NUDIX domain-containing protein [Methanomethylophilus sp.]MDD4668377.1 NUDIX domain-containing protein [Methanomethylophilus sp.]
MSSFIYRNDGPDTNQTVYTVAFHNGYWLMVWNPHRKGWEMPGGHVKEGESRLLAAKREFREESGFDVDIRDVHDLGYCYVFAGFLGDQVTGVYEMLPKLFDEIPEHLSFTRKEYEEVVPWARDALFGTPLN